MPTTERTAAGIRPRSLHPKVAGWICAVQQSTTERGFHMPTSRFPEFRDGIAALPAASSYARDQLMTETFLLDRDGDISVYYAPFDHVNESARLVLVGLTPGWTQMNVSFAEARGAITDDESDDDVLKRAKRVASFSGSMRTNLVSMLDELGISAALGVESASHLFDPYGEDHLQSTSALRYPVFIDGKNYSGHPAAATKPVLRPYFEVLADELASVDSALVVPLGKAVEGILAPLTADGSLDSSRCLFGFPHPSGANAHRARLFEADKGTMSEVVDRWFA